MVGSSEPQRVTGWGGFPESRSRVAELHWTGEELPPTYGASLLPFGLGRSYGDVCLNDGGTLVSTRGLDRLIDFDARSGVVTAEAGMSLDALLAFCVPRGWFVPVTPGTRHVTLGGAVANDVHGKNHHRVGTFGRQVRGLQLRRSDGEMECSPNENGPLFRATIGGLGLTGLIESVALQLKPIRNSWLDVESVRFGSVEEFIAKSLESAATYEYVVASVDASRPASFGSGVLLRANHSTDGAELTPPAEPKLAVPTMPPFRLVPRAGAQAVCALQRMLASRKSRSRVSLGPFFYPLDVVAGWNRLYGPDGFLQWQGLIPLDRVDVAKAALRCAATDAGGSFLTVMKLMGDLPAAGLMSFSGPGLTIACDFPNGEREHRAVARLNEMIVEAGGRLYPAKDSTMTPSQFRRSFPQWGEFSGFIDPRFRSSFWRRVAE